MAAKFYVYELVDPRDGAVFYVGKGMGHRIANHETEARRAAFVTRKVSRIREIWADGLQVERRHVAYFWSEADAYSFEAERVREIGLAVLTNEIPGGARAGRRAGTPNRMTRRLRQVIEHAAGLSRDAGVAFLAVVANAEPEVFCRLLLMCLPKKAPA